MRTAGASADVTRRRIRRAAVELFARKGFAATGIREIAAEAGVTSGALYGYMGTKEELLVDIMRSTILPLTEHGEPLSTADRSAAERLVALVEQHVRFHCAHPLDTLITDTELRALTGPRRAAVLQLRDGYEQVWRRVIADGVGRGEFRVADEPVATAAVLDLCTGVASWYGEGGRLSLDRMCLIYADLALGVVRAERDGTPLRRDELDVPPAAALAPAPPPSTPALRASG